MGLEVTLTEGQGRRRHLGSFSRVPETQRVPTRAPPTMWTDPEHELRNLVQSWLHHVPAVNLWAS